MYWLRIREIFKQPTKFDSLEMEANFQDQYRLSGLQFSKIALTVGLIVIVLFWLMLSIFQFETQASARRQIIRLVIAFILLLTIINIAYRPKQVKNNYVLNLGLPIALCSVFVGGLGFIPLDSGGFSENRFVAGIILFCWLAYGFTKLPIKLVFLICIFLSILNFISTLLHQDNHSVAIFIYLVVGNLIGWISAVQLERRERILFAINLENLVKRDIANFNAKKAKTADLAKSRILAAVNHDLRQPLASLALYVQQLREQVPSHDTRLLATADCLDACVTAISSDLDHLAELGADEPGALVPVEIVDLRTVLERIDRVYAGLARNAGVRLVLRLPEAGESFILSNESRLWDVLSNLVSNAIKFGDPVRDHWVLVRVRQRADRWIVVVQDNGIGIPADQQELVFDEYFRVSGSVRSRRSGQGLGLSSARDATARLAGHVIDFCSRVGYGTRFVLEIPAVSPDAEKNPLAAHGPGAGVSIATGAVRRPSDSAVSGRGRRLTGAAPGSAAGGRAKADEISGPVLLVEDDEAMSDVLGRTLERWGFSVRHAVSGEEAIEWTLNSQDLLTAIIADFRLPGGWDGLRLIEQLRSLEGQRTPALILSGEFRVETLRNDAPADVQIMSKPPDIARLRAFLEQARSIAIA